MFDQDKANNMLHLMQNHPQQVILPTEDMCCITKQRIHTKLTLTDRIWPAPTIVFILLLSHEGFCILLLYVGLFTQIK